MGDARMSGSRLALVADDQRLAAAVQAHLRPALGAGVLVCSFAAVRSHLSRDADGPLLLLVGGPGDAEQARHLVQDVFLQKLPPLLVLLQAGPAERLAELAPYVSRLLRWPDEAAVLDRLVRERVGRSRHFPGTGPETVEAVIARRLVQHTPSLLPLVERIALAAAHDVTVLLTGETGTGKTHLARLMHDCSPRKSSPFLAVPCGALPASLIESALFGHVRGAFTGATDKKIGKFEAAGQGTLLLDEIDTLGLEQQAGLLRVLETGEYEPVGSNETKVCAARIVVASNWDLEDAVARGRFREDLYYRLNVMSFHLPPLRERVQDVAPLVRGFAARYNRRFHKELFDVSPQALELLESHPWPGNIRQLENAVQQAVLMSGGPEVLAEHLPAFVREVRPLPAVAPSRRADSLRHSREVTERRAIVQALASHANSRSRAARALGISRVTLYKKMRRYGLLSEPAPEDEPAHDEGPGHGGA
jgi:transcriptional regulator with PAS, ATPase and Fis domain